MLGAFACALALAALGAALAPTAASAQSGAQTQLLNDANVSSTSCPAAGACVAVGSYQATGGVPLGLLLTQKLGRWSSSIEARLPPGASAAPNVNLASVACAAPSSCAAVGNYESASFLQQGVLINLRGSSWRRGVRAPLPAGTAGDPDVTLSGVSCGAPGSCTAVGSYTDQAGNPVALALSETKWRWAVGQALPLPSGAAAAPSSALDAVSCAAAGDCSAVGWFTDANGSIQGLLETEQAGSWRSAQAAGLPAGAGGQPQVTLDSISCASAGNCAAVGDYLDVSDNQLGLIVDQRRGRWAAGIGPGLPANALGTQATMLDSVSCTGPGDCTAVGQYTDQAQTFQGLLLSERSGAWGQGIEATLPAGSAANQVVTLNSVACTAFETCVVAGNYFKHHPAGLLLSEIAGRWLAPFPAFMPPGEAANPYATLTSVACASGGYCTAAGTYMDAADNGQGVLLDGNGRYFARGLEAPLPGGLETAIRRHHARHRAQAAKRAAAHTLARHLNQRTIAATFERNGPPAHTLARHSAAR